MTADTRDWVLAVDLPTSARLAPVAPVATVDHLAVRSIESPMIAADKLAAAATEGSIALVHPSKECRPRCSIGEDQIVAWMLDVRRRQCLIHAEVIAFAHTEAVVVVELVVQGCLAASPVQMMLSSQCPQLVDETRSCHRRFRTKTETMLAAALLVTMSKRD